MQLPQIRLQSQMAKIELQSVPAEQTIQQREAQQSIEQPKANLEIKTKPSKLSLDQTQAWRDMGMVNTVEFTRNFAQRGRQSLYEGIARRVREGDQLMRIENGGNPIASQAASNAYGQKKEFNIGWIPSHGAVKIDYRPANVDIDVKRNKPRITAEPQKPIIDYQAGKAEARLKQHANLEIDFVHVNWKQNWI